MLRLSIKASAEAVCPPFLRPYWDRLITSPIGSRLARGVFWSMVGTVISSGLMLVASVVVARLLGKTGYGELEMIKSTVGMLGVFAGLALGLTATKHVAECRQNDRERAGRILGLSSLMAFFSGGLMSLGLLFFAPWLAEHTINAPHLVVPLRIGAIILFISALNGAQTGALAGFEAFKTIAKVNLLVGLISFPIMLAGAYWGRLQGVVCSIAICLCFNWYFNHVALCQEAARSGIQPTLKECGAEWSILWRFSLPAVLSGALIGPVNWVCGALLVNQPGGYSEMGVFSVANQWYHILLFLPNVLGSVVLPVLSEQLGQRKTGQSNKTLVVAIKVNLVVIAPIAIIASFASPFIMNLYGRSFSDGWPTLIVVLMTAALLAIQTPVGQIIAASGRMWTGLIMNAGWASVFIISILLLIL